jgi:hypothetical protein
LFILLNYILYACTDALQVAVVALKLERGTITSASKNKTRTIDFLFYFHYTFLFCVYFESNHIDTICLSRKNLSRALFQYLRTYIYIGNGHMLQTENTKKNFIQTRYFFFFFFFFFGQKKH